MELINKCITSALILFSVSLFAVDYESKVILTLHEEQEVEHLVLNEKGQLIVLVVHYGSSSGKDQYQSYYYDPKTGLSSLDGENIQIADINDSGLAVGTLQEGMHAEFFLYEPETGVTKGLGGGISSASAINNGGMVGGWYLTREGLESSTGYFAMTHSFIYLPNHGVVQTGSLGAGFHRMHVSAISENGAMVGYADHMDGTRHAYRYHPQNGMTDLGPIGQLGKVIGSTEEGDILAVWSGVDAEGKSNESGYSFIIDKDNRRIRLNSLGKGDSDALAINRKGQVVGRVTDELGVRRAFAADKKGNMHFLGTAVNESLEKAKSIAFDVNERGQVAGAIHMNTPINLQEEMPIYRLLLSRWAPVVWDHMTDQPTRLRDDQGVFRGMAMTMNDQGQILLLGYREGEETVQLFLLTPKAEVGAN